MCYYKKMRISFRFLLLKEVLFLAILVFVPFFPIFLGYNFLPFERYPQYCKEIIDLGKKEWDYNYSKEIKKNVWVKGLEHSWFSLSLSDDFFISQNYKKGRIPFYNPYNGCGFSTFGSGQFKPLNPFKLPFYTYPTIWMWSFCHFLTLLFGAIFFYKFLILHNFRGWGALLATSIFSLNPWIIDRLYQTDGTGYLIIPFVLFIFCKSKERGLLYSSSLISMSLFLLCSVSHPTIFVLSFIFCFGWFFLNDKFDIKKIYLFILTSLFTLLLTSIYLLPIFFNLFESISYKNLFRVKYDLSFKAFFEPLSDLYILPPILAIFFIGLLAEKSLKYFKWTFLFSSILLVSFPKIGTFPADFIEKKFYIHYFYFKPFFWLSFAIILASGVNQLSQNLDLKKKLLILFVMVSSLSTTLVIYFCTDSPSRSLFIYPNILFCEIALLIVLIGVVFFIQKPPYFKEIMLPLLIIPLIFPLSFNGLCWNKGRPKISEVAKFLVENYPSSRTMSIAFMPSFIIPPNWGCVTKVR